MRDSIEVTGIGTIHLTKPRSFVAISDVYAEWCGPNSRAVMTRLICASIGLAWDREQNTLNAPIYDVSNGAIVSYGGEVLDWLLRRGAVVEVLWGYPDLINELWAILPKEDEVAAAAESFQDGSGSPGCDRAADSPAVESAA